MSSADYLESMFGLNGKVAVVIGGTGELCGAMAEGLAAAGAEVVLVGRSEEKAKARLGKIAAKGGKGWFRAVEATSKKELELLLDAVLERSGKVDIVINGAGINSGTPFLDIDDEDFDKVMRVNLKSLLFSCQVFGGYMVKRGEGGSIINIGSMSGLIPLSGRFVYSITKAGVHNLTMNLAREWAPHRVRVNTLVPGFFPAEQNRKLLTPERIAAVLGHTPMRRLGEANELVGAALLLASERAASFITGDEFVVDGGYSAMTI
jgi:NAD(P)-dependent dehydrogenase (short-subunit alcohol dehydrogenase family)